MYLLIPVAPLLQQLPAVTKAQVNANLIIPCKVLRGNPKPNISWYFKTAESDKFVSIEKSDEELHLPAATLTYTGHYKCIAKNKVEADETTTHLVVEVSYTGHTKDIHSINLLVGETRKIKCLVPYTPTDSIKWYMNGKDTMVTEPFITLTDVDISMDGNYTCHITSSQDSHSDTYVLEVGKIPVFINELDTTNIDWRGSGYLDCKAKAKPEAKAKWTYNGAPVDVASNMLDLKISGWGQYKCKISNVHGYVTRTFNVTSNGCLININTEATPYTPLLLDLSSNLPLLEVVNEYIFIKPGTVFKLSCHNRDKTRNCFKKFPNQHDLDVTCNHEDTFWIGQKLYKYSDFHCNEKVVPVVVRTGNKCLGDNTELIRVGFNVDEFIEVYKVCFDTKKVVSLYTRSVMRQKHSQINTKAFKWFRHNKIGYRKISLEYTCENALSSVCYARTQLVNVLDTDFGPPQASTFINHLNTIPLWKPGSDTNRMTWQAIEDNIRVQLSKSSEITVWSGASEYVSKGGGNIPRFLWKIVMFEESDVTVIIYVNDPAPTVADIRCKNICDAGSSSWIQSPDPFTYCCNLEEFLTTFKLPENIVGEILLPDIDERFGH